MASVLGIGADARYKSHYIVCKVYANFLGSIDRPLNSCANMKIVQGVVEKKTLA